MKEINIDDILLELSYRIPNGIPDFSNELHLEILKEVVDEYFINEPNRFTIVNELVSNLKKSFLLEKDKEIPIKDTLPKKKKTKEPSAPEVEAPPAPEIETPQPKPEQVPAENPVPKKKKQKSPKPVDNETPSASEPIEKPAEKPTDDAPPAPTEEPSGETPSVPEEPTEEPAGDMSSDDSENIGQSPSSNSGEEAPKDDTGDEEIPKDDNSGDEKKIPKDSPEMQQVPAFKGDEPSAVKKGGESQAEINVKEAEANGLYVYRPEKDYHVSSTVTPDGKAIKIDAVYEKSNGTLWLKIGNNEYQVNIDPFNGYKAAVALNPGS